MGGLSIAAENSEVFSSSLCFTKQAGALAFCSRRVLQPGDTGASCGALRAGLSGSAPRGGNACQLPVPGRRWLLVSRNLLGGGGRLFFPDMSMDKRRVDAAGDPRALFWVGEVVSPRCPVRVRTVPSSTRESDLEASGLQGALCIAALLPPVPGGCEMLLSWLRGALRSAP